MAQQDPLECLKNCTIMDMLSNSAWLSDKEFENKLREFGLLANKRKCVCGSEMKIDVNQWICDHCGKSQSVFADSFFEGIDISAKLMFQLVFLWQAVSFIVYRNLKGMIVRSLTIENIEEGIKRIRGVCEQHFEKHPVVIGGPNVIVQIGEKRLDNRGHNKDDVWIFGGAEKGRHKNCFFVLCPNNQRDAATLLPIIQKHIAPGTTIMSNSAAKYTGIGSLSEGYHHMTFNHATNFVNPDTGASTQTLKALWGKVPLKNEQSCGFDTFEFMWRQRYFCPDGFYYFWKHVRELYKFED